jgi:glycosyltransferase involved in cell wall biosynthesis
MTEKSGIEAQPTLGVHRRSPSSGQVHVVFSIDTMSVGGTEMNAVRTAERLDADRYRLTVVTLRGNGPLAERYERIGVPIVRFPIFNLYGRSALRQGALLARFLRGERADIVHCHDRYSNFFTVMAARAAGVPVVIASKRWTHSPIRYHLANAIGFRAATRVLANSSSVARSLRDRDLIPAKRIVVVPNFVDEEAFEAPSPSVLARWRNELRLRHDDLVVGIIASLTPIKDHATLLRAIAVLAPRFPTLHLVIVGEGPLRSALAALAQQLDITDRVRFAGLRPQTPSFHFLFDVSVLCSTSEGFPNSIIEAMAAARPVVATAVGGIPDAVREADTGLLVPPSAPADLADALVRVLTDPIRARAMGRAALTRARSEYHARIVVGSLEALYDQLLAASSVKPHSSR